MRAKRRHRFLRCLQALRTECPPKLPVRLRIREIRKGEIVELGSKVDGFISESHNGTFLHIVIDKNCAYSSMVDTLIHEWAHAMVYPTMSHGKLWGKAYAKAYVTVEREMDKIRAQRLKA